MGYVKYINITTEMGLQFQGDNVLGYKALLNVLGIKLNDESSPLEKVRAWEALLELEASGEVSIFKVDVHPELEALPPFMAPGEVLKALKSVYIIPSKERTDYITAFNAAAVEYALLYNVHTGLPLS